MIGLIAWWLLAGSAAPAQQPSTTALWDSARAASRRGDHSAARSLYDSLLTLNPTHAAALNNRGNVLRRAGRFRDAISDYDSALKLRPDYALAHGNRAQAFLALGDTAAAKADLRRGAALGHLESRRRLAALGEAPPARVDASPAPARSDAEERRALEAMRIFQFVSSPRVLLAGAVAAVVILFASWRAVRSGDAPVFQIPLERHERQLWSGRPAQGLVLREGGMAGVLFGIVFIAVVTVVGANLVLMMGPVAFLFAAPLLFAGVYVMILQFFHDAWRRKNTLYLLTDRRIVIQRRGHTVQRRLAELPPMTLENWKDGTGTITFGESNKAMGARRGKHFFGSSIHPAFELIDDASAVYEQAVRAQSDARQRGASTA